jgi:hypothetical protein
VNVIRELVEQAIETGYLTLEAEEKLRSIISLCLCLFARSFILRNILFLRSRCLCRKN